MPEICYVPRMFSAGSLDIIAKANQVCRTYAAQGYDLTLRQLYYQFVSRDWLPNRDSEYKRLGSVINDARLAGLLDWDYIVDRTRNLRDLAHWDSPESIIDAVAEQYRTDRWDRQHHRLEVWIEKDALVGVIEGVCERHDVPYFSCRGYTSQSELWGAAQRMISYNQSGQEPVVIHLGDHDPSGIDMTRDIRSRMLLFGANVEVVRIALNMDQVIEYDPPPNPAKLTDARARGYIAEHGPSSWELDALDPATLDRLIEDEILSWRDVDDWDAATTEMESQRTVLTGIASNWTAVADFVQEQGS